MPLAVEYLAAYVTTAGAAIGGNLGAALIMNSIGVSWIITAAAVPALGSANRRQATRHARGRQ